MLMMSIPPDIRSLVVKVVDNIYLTKDEYVIKRSLKFIKRKSDKELLSMFLDHCSVCGPDGAGITNLSQVMPGTYRLVCNITGPDYNGEYDSWYTLVPWKE